MSKLKNLNIKQPKRRTTPLWDGPCSDTPNGGVTQSLVSKYLACRERFRVMTVEGLRGQDEFRPALEYGNMWHVCEEAFAKTSKVDKLVFDTLREHARQLCKKYPMQQEQISHWYEMCKAQFPFYAEHWSQHPDVKGRTPIFQEQEFKVPYPLPSGRVVYLRGKWDGVDLIEDK